MTDSNHPPIRSVLLIGGPDAGKSNYLFRLWVALNDGRGALTKDGLPNDVAYLRDGAERLLEGEFAGRTSKEVHECIEMPVKSNILGAQTRRGALVIPDMPGEQIRAIYRNRQWSHAWEDHVSTGCGCLIFVRAGSSENVVPLDWATCIEMYGAAIAAPSSTAPPETNSSLVAATSTPGDMQAEAQLAQKQTDPKNGEAKSELPTQVMLTDWMQFLRRAISERMSGVHRPRIGIVVSAWDAVPADQQTAGPMQYLKGNFPLLHQFLETNGDDLDLQVFGLSVVSGDLKADAEFKKQFETGNPREFGFVIHSLQGDLRQDVDVTLPVAWALGYLDASSN